MGSLEGAWEADASGCTVSSSACQACRDSDDCDYSDAATSHHAVVHPTLWACIQLQHRHAARLASVLTSKVDLKDVTYLGRWLAAILFDVAWHTGVYRYSVLAPQE